MRLVTRADLDGLTCAVLITSCEDIDDVQLAHPQDITERRFISGSVATGRGRCIRPLGRDPSAAFGRSP